MTNGDLFDKPREPFGTEPHKLHRATDPDTSKAAAYAVDSASLEAAVYRAVERRGIIGATQDEVLSDFVGKPYSSVTARFRALLDKGYIEDTLCRRPGRSGKAQRVVRAIKPLVTKALEA